MKKVPRKKSTVKAVSCYLTRTCGIVVALFYAQAAQASSLKDLAANADIPEEILRTEIIVEARSPLTGELLTAAEYAQLQASLDREGRSPQLNSEIRQLVYLLRLRRILKPIIPFIKEEQVPPASKEEQAEPANKTNPQAQ